MERKYAWHNYDDATMEKVYSFKVIHIVNFR